MSTQIPARKHPIGEKKSSTTWKRVAPGIYRHEPTGAYYERSKINGSYTFRKLEAHRLGPAKEELAAKRTKRIRVALGIEHEDSEVMKKRVGEILDAYEKENCPYRGLRPRTGKSLDQAKQFIKMLRPWWENYLVSQIILDHCGKYARWRMAHAKRGTARRAVDLELQTLSNALAFTGVSPNPLDGRETFWKAEVHCRDCAPKDSDQFHDVGKVLLSDPRSEVLGWQFLFEGLTGCRTNEICQLRIDPTSRDVSGFIENDRWLWLKRSKGGVNPFVVLTDRPELLECIKAHHNWHRERFPQSAWWFPNRWDLNRHVDFSSLSHRLRDICGTLNLHRITSHGLRSFFVTVRRSQGIADGQIAAEIGDKTVSLMESTYGSIPASWRGGETESFLPKNGDPAWIEWLK